MILTVDEKQTTKSMETTETMNDVAMALSILRNEEELIIKPLHRGTAHEMGAVECGRIVSRTNKPLFDYRIGDITNSCMFNSIFDRTIVLIDPITEERVLELSHNRLPFLFKLYWKKDVRCSATLSSEIQSIGSIRQGLAFANIWYNVYSVKHEHVVSLMLPRSHLKSRIQHRVLEVEILDADKTTNIGRIYPFSTDLERTQYGQAVAMNVPKDMKVESKATLLMAALILKSRLN